jgi:small subunit ribosomal protein S19e
MGKGVTVKDVPAQDFIAALAKHLKAKLELPAWHDIVKTAAFKEMPPRDDDWYFVRAGKHVIERTF